MQVENSDLTTLLAPSRSLGGARKMARSAEQKSTPGSASGQLNPLASDLAARLQELAAADTDYWSFVAKAKRDFVHGLFQYPAMMVPRLQRELMEECVYWDPDLKTVFDPFSGSGTVLTESMILGLDFMGTDINPLAVLLCKAKAGTFDMKALRASLPRILRRARSDRSSAMASTFRNRDTWFSKSVSLALSRLHRSIAAEPSVEIRRFWWVVVAETVRLASNSRTSTYKLHMRSAEQLKAKRTDPILLFEDLGIRNLEAIRDQSRLLQERSLLRGVHYKGRTEVRIGDVRTVTHRQLADLLVTSPPYGDNHTTVPYGQASYLPLQWIDLADIEPTCTDSCLRSTHEIDARSLGGSRRHALTDAVELADRSESFKETFAQLSASGRDATVRVSAFVRDLDHAVGPAIDALKPGGVMIWTMGDRRAGGVRIPMARILRDLLEPHATFVAEIDRPIPTDRKRMAPKNSAGETMAHEIILVMQKTASPDA